MDFSCELLNLQPLQHEIRLLREDPMLLSSLVNFRQPQEQLAVQGHKAVIDGLYEYPQNTDDLDDKLSKDDA
jgi:hypothetical protein